MEYVLYKTIMAKESPCGIFLFVYEWVMTALLSVLFLNETLCSISLLIIYKINNFTVSLLPILLTLPCCQMHSGNQSRLYLNSCSFSCSPHILLLILLIYPCNVFIQGDIFFALQVVSSAFPNVWNFFLLVFMSPF
jgi:hypothetical protein